MAKLKGGSYVDGDLVVANNISAGGTITATSKNFEIDDPRGNGGRLRHSCLEGPENAVFYRGTGEGDYGWATVTLPDYFESLTREDGRTVQVTPLMTGPREAQSIGASEVKDGKFTVWSDSPRKFRFYWMVIAERKDIPGLTVESGKKEIEE